MVQPRFQAHQRPIRAARSSLNPLEPHPQGIGRHGEVRGVARATAGHINLYRRGLGPPAPAGVALGDGSQLTAAQHLDRAGNVGCQHMGRESGHEFHLDQALRVVEDQALDVVIGGGGQRRCHPGLHLCGHLGQARGGNLWAERGIVSGFSPLQPGSDALIPRPVDGLSQGQTRALSLARLGGVIATATGQPRRAGQEG